MLDFTQWHGSVVVVVNRLAPSAGRCDWRAKVREVLDKRLSVTGIEVDSYDEVYEASREAALRGAAQVIVVGGDGSANACLNGLRGTRARMVFIPAGTANDLGRILGQSVSPIETVARLAEARTRELDAISVNDRVFYSVGGAGWAAEVAHMVNRWRSHEIPRSALAPLGSLIYLIACFVVVLGYLRLGARVNVTYTSAVDGRVHTESLDSYGVVIANADRLGKSFYTTPMSRVDDGKFEIILFPRTNRFHLLRALLAGRKGKVLQVPGIKAIQAVSAEIQCDQSMRFFGEGEILQEGTRFSLGIVPKGVRAMAAPAAPEVIVDVADEFAKAS